jgi:hypothetical protein
MGMTFDKWSRLHLLTELGGSERATLPSMRVPHSYPYPVLISRGCPFKSPSK